MDTIKEDEELHIADHPDALATLHVTVHAAKNLLAKDLNGSARATCMSSCL